MTALSSQDLVWLDRLRAAGSASFAALGWPSRALEDWRYTDLEPILETAFEPAGEVGTSAALEALIASQNPDSDLVVFVNGRHSTALSRIGELPEGAYLGSFATWAATYPEAAQVLLRPTHDRTQALIDLNIGAFTDGLALVLPDATRLSRPLLCIHWGQGDHAVAIHTRGHLQLGAGAQATLSEIWAGEGKYWTNSVTSVVLGADSVLRLASLQDEATTAYHTAALGVALQDRAVFDGFQLALGGAISRREYRATLAGPQADFILNGSTLLSGRQAAATVTVVDHTAAGYAIATKQGTTSNQIFKTALADRAHGVFQGRIIVQPGAQKTDAGMLNKSVLLSDRAVIDTKPELEIYADDVKCSHGASVGDLDDTALFYLRSRGIEPEVARRMLIDAFVTEPIDHVADQEVAGFLRAAVAARLATLKG